MSALALDIPGHSDKIKLREKEYKTQTINCTDYKLYRLNTKGCIVIYMYKVTWERPAKINK